MYTYLIEGIWCIQEGFVYKTMYPDKAFYVMFMCYTLGYICSTVKTWEKKMKSAKMPKHDKKTLLNEKMYK